MKIIIKNGRVFGFSYNEDDVETFLIQRHTISQYSVLELNDIPYQYKDDRFELLNIGGLILLEYELELLYNILDEHQILVNRLQYITQYLHNIVDISFMDKYELPDDKTHIVNNILSMYNLSTIINILERTDNHEYAN